MKIKKAIVLDMDNTLECGVKHGIDDYTMFLRPDIDTVISKLKEAKEKGIDIILCSTAVDSWIEQFLTLKPEFRELFTKIYSRDNTDEWNNLNIADFPIEKLFIPDGKPVTAFGYNSVLYIDDAPASLDEMQNIYADSIEEPKSNYRMIETFENFIPDELYDEIEDFDKKDLDRVIEYLPDDIRSKLPSKNIDTTFFNVPFYSIDSTALSYIFALLNDPNIDPEKRQKIADFIECANREPGCRMICDEIDKFVKKDFAPGLTLTAEYYEQEMATYKAKIMELRNSIKPESQTPKAPQSLIDEYMSQDRTGPYIGILPEIRMKSAVKSFLKQEGVIEQVGSKENEQQINDTVKLEGNDSYPGGDNR